MVVFQALALVDEETKRYRPTKNYLEHLGATKTDAFEVSRNSCLILLIVCLKLLAKIDL
jgi:hypothetical protein